jgi:hypothetical protein
MLDAVHWHADVTAALLDIAGAHVSIKVATGIEFSTHCGRTAFMVAG